MKMFYRSKNVITVILILILLNLSLVSGTTVSKTDFRKAALKVALGFLDDPGVDFSVTHVEDFVEIYETTTTDEIDLTTITNDPTYETNFEQVFTEAEETILPLSEEEADPANQPPVTCGDCQPPKCCFQNMGCVFPGTCYENHICMGGDSNNEHCGDGSLNCGEECDYNDLTTPLVCGTNSGDDCVPCTMQCTFASPANGGCDGCLSGDDCIPEGQCLEGQICSGGLLAPFDCIHASQGLTCEGSCYPASDSCEQDQANPAVCHRCKPTCFKTPCDCPVLP